MGERLASPKPYSFVPFSKQPVVKVCPEDYGGHAGFHSDRFTGRIRVKVRVLTPLHIGDGLFTPLSDNSAGKGNVLGFGHVRSKDQVLIPGSSLKGIIRSIFEMITPSCVCVAPKGISGEYQPCNATGKRRTRKLCPACQVFGAMGYLGQVQFMDILLEQDEVGMECVNMPVLYGPNVNGSSSLYKRGKEFIGYKVYYHGAPASGSVPVEVIKQGVEFSFELRFFNLEEAQLGAFLIACGVGEPRLRPKVGGYKPACLGSVEMELECLQGGKGADIYRSFSASRRELEPGPFYEAARELVDEKCLAVLQDVWSWPPKKACPGGVY